jgi:hypothetical protein
MVDPPTSLGSFSSASLPIPQRQEDERHKEHESGVGYHATAPTVSR